MTHDCSRCELPAVRWWIMSFTDRGVGVPYCAECSPRSHLTVPQGGILVAGPFNQDEALAWEVLSS